MDGEFCFHRHSTGEELRQLTASLFTFLYFNAIIFLFHKGEGGGEVMVCIKGTLFYLLFMMCIESVRCVVWFDNGEHFKVFNVSPPNIFLFLGL